MANLDSKRSIDLSKSSEADLVQALNRCRHNRFSMAYSACLSEIDARKADGRWSEAFETEIAYANKRPQFSVQNRFISYVFDGTLIILISLAFSPASHYLNQIGLWGVLPFWILNFCYGTLFDGRLGRGQTLGKKIKHLRVMGVDGAQLSWFQASVRGVYLAALVGIRYGMYGFFPNSIYSKAFDFFLIGFFAFDILFLFRHPQKRSLLDLWTNTLVQDTDYPCPQFVRATAIAKFRGWMTGAAVVVIAILIYGLFFGASPSDFGGDSYRSEIAASTHLKYVGIGKFKRFRDSRVTGSGTTYMFWLSPEYLIDPDEVSRESARAREILDRQVLVSPQEAGGNAAERGSLNVVVEGHVFKGLLPISYVYRNLDRRKKPIEP